MRQQSLVDQPHLIGSAIERNGPKRQSPFPDLNEHDLNLGKILLKTNQQLKHRGIPRAPTSRTGSAPLPLPSPHSFVAGRERRSDILGCCQNAPWKVGAITTPLLPMPLS